MKSNVSVTYQIDDISLAAKELLEGVLGNGFRLLRNSVGILFCYSDMDSDILAKTLSENIGFEVVGCTGIANMEHRDGFHSMAATFMVLTADDCDFAVSATEDITGGNVQEQITAAYKEACSKLPDTPKLIFSLPPYILEIMLDAYTNAYNTAAPGIPVVGGLPSYNANGDRNLVFRNGRASETRLVMIVISGNVRPQVVVKNVSGDVSRKRKVTKAVNNVIYEVGGQRFTDYLKEVGLPVEELAQGNSTITFVSNPLLLESASNEIGQKYSFARTLHEINLEEGSGTAIGQIPEGATVSICSLEREQIEKAALDGICEIKEKIAGVSGDEYQYSSLLAISCIGRHLLLLPDNDAEVKQLLSDYPEGLSMAGFYSYGEIGPWGIGSNHNFAHNESLVLCAF